MSEKRLAAAGSLKASLVPAFPETEFEVRPSGELVIRASSGDLVALARTLAGAKPHPLNYLSCVSGVDWPDDNELEVVWSLHSLPGPVKVSLRARADRSAAEPSVPSLTSVWPTAEYQEREVYDLFGVHFAGHPDLSRILLKPDFEGYPLRKDFVDGREPRRRVTREDYQP